MNSKKEYKNVCAPKQYLYNRKILKGLENCIKDQRQFWSRLKQGTGNAKTNHAKAVNIETLYRNFRDLFAVSEDDVIEEVDNRNDDAVEGDIEEALLDQLISDDEVLHALKSLNVNKACSGVLTPRHFTVCMEKLVPYLRVFFNLLFFYW